MKKVLGIEIRFNLTKTSISIVEFMSALKKWNFNLQPSHFEDLYDYDYDIDPIDWDSEKHINKLQDLINQKTEFSWLLSMLNMEETGVKIKLKDNELSFSIGLENFENTIVDSLIHLLDLLKSSRSPDIVMFYDRNSDDAECIFVGLGSLRIIAPVIFLNNNFIDFFEVSEKFDNEIKLCDIGRIINVKNDIWKKSTPKEKKIAKDLEKYLLKMKNNQ